MRLDAADLFRLSLILVDSGVVVGTSLSKYLLEKSRVVFQVRTLNEVCCVLKTNTLDLPKTTNFSNHNKMCVEKSTGCIGMAPAMRIKLVEDLSICNCLFTHGSFCLSIGEQNRTVLSQLSNFWMEILVGLPVVLI